MMYLLKISFYIHLKFGMLFWGEPLHCTPLSRARLIIDGDKFSFFFRACSFLEHTLYMSAHHDCHRLVFTSGFLSFLEITNDEALSIYIGDGKKQVRRERPARHQLSVSHTQKGVLFFIYRGLIFLDSDWSENGCLASKGPNSEQALHSSS